MDVGVALPNAVPRATGAQLTEWARRAEARGFSTLGTIDRIRYDNYEPLVALAAAAAVTERIGLATTVLLIVGGHVDATFARMVRFADGWISSGTGPDLAGEGAEKARGAWSEAGREGEPHIMALAYFSLGERAEEDARENLADYYAWLGDEVAGMIVDAAAKDAGAVERYLAAYEEAGCDELVFCPSSADPRQVDLLADAAGL
jgi:alkanesulfonate monooxygenase SsuD/methylene tetrahydromethanopterin reductase-like flavin-dependent oxidoreductase (luciferase family)